MTKKIPYMPLYVSDYLADTTHLTCEEHGAYLLVLFALWRNDGTLPCDDVALSRIARLPFKRWEKIRSNIISFFEVEGAALTHKRVASEIQKSKEKIFERTRAGKLGGDAKALKTHKPPLAKASVLPEQNPANLDSDKSLAKAKQADVPLCISLGERITDRMGVTNDPRWIGNWSTVTVWLSRGFDPELDIWPTVAGIVDRKKKLGQQMPGSLGYFSRAIEDTHTRRVQSGITAPSPESQVELVVVKSGTPEFKAWIRHFKSVGRKTKFIETQDKITVPTQFPPTHEVAA